MRAFSCANLERLRVTALFNFAHIAVAALIENDIRQRTVISMAIARIVADEL
jgi:hypothetical protein